MAARAHLFMRIVQHDCQRNYAVFQTTFQIGAGIGAEIMCLQESCLGGKGMVHLVYEFRFGNIGKSRQQRFAIGVKKDLGGKMIVETR